jgi:hypothetical protein
LLSGLFDASGAGFFIAQQYTDVLINIEKTIKLNSGWVEEIPHFPFASLWDLARNDTGFWQGTVAGAEDSSLTLGMTGLR